MRKKKIWLSFIFLLLAVLLAVMIVLFLGIRKATQYTKYVSLGDRYLQEMQYEDAIIAYKDAIHIDEKRAGGYLRVSTVYETTGDYDQAGTVLLDGYEKAKGKDKIQERLVVIYPAVSEEIQVKIKETIDEDALNEPEENSSEQAEDQTEETDYTVAYEEILAEYKEAAENNFSSEILEQSRHINGGVWNFSGQEKYSVYYRYVDLAGDGEPELLISVNEKEAPYEILDIYTLVNGSAVRVIPSGGSVGYRELYSVCFDGRIKNLSGGGVNHTEYTYYKLGANSADLTMDEKYVYDSSANPAYIHIDNSGNETAISESDFDEMTVRNALTV